METTTKFNSDGTINKGEISDGYHTFNELYEHRAVLLASLMHVLDTTAINADCWISDLHSDGTMFDGMFIAGITINTVGNEVTLTYHIENDQRHLFEGINHIERAPIWDGSTPADGLEYLKNNLIEYIRSGEYDTANNDE